MCRGVCVGWGELGSRLDTMLCRHYNVFNFIILLMFLLLNSIYIAKHFLALMPSM